jgi:predicted small lipoprotein YifL
MRIKAVLRFVFLLLLLGVFLGCGRKAPPTLPEKSSSIINMTNNKIQGGHSDERYA